MNNNDNNLQSLSSALEEHSAEGIEILYAEPNRLISLMILMIAGLLLAFLVWSFFGRADVIVSASGVLELSLIHISEPTRLLRRSRMPSSA